ncbi:MAG: DUF445 family protein [Bacteroidia bacterium]|nr:DUF445 family protein [Bacteroidia bacterium]
MLYSLPFIAAFVGWLTNWIALKLMFYPQKPINFYFFELQGIFPKRQQEVAQQIAKMVSAELISFNDIRTKLNSPEQLNDIKMHIDEKINDYLCHTFPSNYPITSWFFGHHQRQGIREDLILEVEKFTPEIIQKYTDNLEGELNIERMVGEKISTMDPMHFEVIINGIMKKEFALLSIVGGVLGFTVGLVQLAILSI